MDIFVKFAAKSYQSIRNSLGYMLQDICTLACLEFVSVLHTLPCI